MMDKRRQSRDYGHSDFDVVNKLVAAPVFILASRLMMVLLPAPISWAAYHIVDTQRRVENMEIRREIGVHRLDKVETTVETMMNRFAVMDMNIAVTREILSRIDRTLDGRK